ncbi:hypothetical protein H7X68_01015 [Candidatus Saccharibacteria bacterium]|nr:hypothetical protein [Candidatus Saccharibacteria bacterium]
MKPTIAIDIDDVLADSTESIRLRVNERVGVDLQLEHYRIEGEYWGYYERVWREHGIIDRVNYDDFEKEMAHDQSHVPLLPGAALAIAELAKRFDIVLITARDSSLEAATRHWLKTYVSDELVDVYFITNHKDSKAKNKGQLCRDLGASWLIDDNTEHCRAAIDQGVKAVLFGEYGWQVSIPETVDRCKDWLAVLEHFSEK